MTWTKDQNERFAANTKRGKVLHAEAERREKILADYLNSNRVKKLKRDVQTARDAVNMNIEAWNDIVLEEHRKRPVKRDSGFSNTYTSVDGELRLNYKEDPKSW
jgi:hypothetical protein